MIELIARTRKDGTCQSLHAHLEETAALAGRFAAKVGLGCQGQVIGLLHDLGKASAKFQEYIAAATDGSDQDAEAALDPASRQGKVDHSTAGAQILFEHLAGMGSQGMLAAQVLSLPILSHHSGLIDCLRPDGEDIFTKRITKAPEGTHRREVESRLANVVGEVLKDTPALTSGINSLVRSMGEAGDSRGTLMFKTGLLVRFLFSCLLDADRLDSARFEHPDTAGLRAYDSGVDWAQLAGRLETHISGFDNGSELNKRRSEISERCRNFADKDRGLFELTVPTGGGKTLSSLRFALHHARVHKMDRIIYIIPYTTIIDQNVKVAREALTAQDGKDDLSSLVLEHHSNLTPELETPRQKLMAENWDAPIVFTTMVQFLETLFGAGTRSARRMHQLANAVLIFDEIQTLPIRCVHMFNTALRFLVQACRSTAVLCTATQPLLGAIMPACYALPVLQDNKIMGDVGPLFAALRRVEVIDMQCRRGWTNDEIARLVSAELNNAGTVLVVVNTKQAAQDLTHTLLTQNLESPVFHLTTGMCPAHRTEVLDEVKQRLQCNEPTICVSTQLIEAGVNIDFGTVVRYAAGLDSIAQAAGRCNREGRRDAGRVLVVNPAHENLDKLKDIADGRDITNRVLDEYKSDPEQFGRDIIGPQAIERYYKYYFFQRAKEMPYTVNKHSSTERDDSLFELLSANKLSNEAYRNSKGAAPRIMLRQSFQTAARAFRVIEDNTIGVVVPYGQEGRSIIADLTGVVDLAKERAYLKCAQRYSVNVFCHQFSMLSEIGAVRETQRGSGVFYVAETHYCKVYGLRYSSAGEMKTLIVGEV